MENKNTNEEMEKAKDFNDRAVTAKKEIDVILDKYELTIGSVFEYRERGITATPQLMDVKKHLPAITSTTVIKVSDLA